MRNSFFSRKNDSTATTCAAGFACSDANTNNNSVLLLTIDTVLAVSISVILGILGITPPTGHAKPVFAGITRQHLVYQESAPTVLVGADFFV